MATSHPGTPSPAATQPGAGGGGYQVVARRYRPQLFADLVGQEHVARGLSGAIESGRIGHAYLFTGARGVGKTSAARIYAKALNCEAGPAAEPCNACDVCQAITTGQDVDVVEIDAASNRGIDEIRQLRQNVAVRPARGRFKVYIIDEVHMLTREAFNALLKTLEEPPGHVKFVFCTTEPEKLPITILSRCQRFDFVTVEASAIARRLAQIVESERAEVSAEALQLIARRAAGSMRDSQSLLEQLLGGATGPVGVDDVHAVIGTGREERIGELLAAVAARDAARAVAALDAALGGGADPGGVLEQLLAALRDCLLASVGCGAELVAGSAGLGVDVVAIGRDLGTATVLAMLQILDAALSRMRTSGHAAVLAEMAVVRLAAIEDLERLALAVDRLAAAETAPTAPRPAAAPAGRSATGAAGSKAAGLGSVGAGSVGVAPSDRGEKKKTDRPVAAESIPQSVAPAPASGGDATSAVVAAATAGPVEPGRPAQLPEAAGVWRAVVDRLEGLAADFAALASGAAWKGETLEVTLPADAATAAAILRRADSSAAISAALAAVLGAVAPHALRVEAAAPAVERSRPAGERPAGAPSQSELLKTAAAHPLVAHARTLFDAAIRRVEPPRQPTAMPAGGSAVAAASDADDPGDDPADPAEGGFDG